MPFDGIVTANIAGELNTTISGGKIEKIYQPEPDELILSIHHDKEKYKVLLTSNSAHARVHLIDENPPNPAHPPAFCMLLRKHLQGGRINQVIQKDTERIIEFWIQSFNELGYPTTKKLIVEIMGKHSNIILMDQDKGTIIDSIKRISLDVNRYRQLLPGLPYVYPPTQDKIPFTDLSLGSFGKWITASNSMLSSTLVGKIMGFSPFFATSLCSRSGVRPDIFGKEVTPAQIENLFKTFQQLLENIKQDHFTPSVWLDSEQIPVDFHSFDDPDFNQVYKKCSFETISAATNYYYCEKSSSNRIKQKSSDLAKILATTLDKLYLKKGRLSEEIIQAENAHVDRLKGELLLANLYRIPAGRTVVTLENYYDDSLVEIPLDARLSPAENAQKYYKKYNKAKIAHHEKMIQREETEREIHYLESVAQSLENAADFTDIDEVRQELIAGHYLKRRINIKTPKNHAAPPHQFFSSNGLRILAGRNNKQNDQLTLKQAGSRDLWFHTKDIPGTHVILFTEGNEPAETDLVEAAAVAAYFSKGKMSENIPVDYAQVKYVKKPSGAKPGMVIFTHNKTLYVNPGLPSEQE